MNKYMIGFIMLLIIGSVLEHITATKASGMGSIICDSRGGMHIDHIYFNGGPYGNYANTPLISLDNCPQPTWDK